jgi:hypothetical protein
MSDAEKQKAETDIEAKAEADSRMKDMKLLMAKELIRKKNERRTQENNDLHSTLKTVLVEVSEANLSAQEMHRNVTFKAQLKRHINNSALIGSKTIVDNSKVEVIVRVDNKE